MKIEVEQKNVPYYLLLLLYGFYVFLAHWIWFGRGIQETLLIALSVIIILYTMPLWLPAIRAKTETALLITIVLLLVECVYGIRRAGNSSYLMQDLRAILGPLVISVGIVISINELSRQGKNITWTIYKFLSVYFLLNNILIVIQYFVPYFLMNRRAIDSTLNQTYYDQLTGFIGINGTTRWTIWGTLLIIINLVYYYEYNNSIFLRRGIFHFIVCCIVAMMNQARSFFLICPATIAVYLFAVQMRIEWRVKQIGIVALVLVLLYIAYQRIAFVHQFIDYMIADKINMYYSGDLDYMVSSNDDRARALVYVLEVGGSFGIGLGAVPMHSTATEAKYIGLNSVSSYVYMMGWVGYLLWTLFFALYGAKTSRKSSIVYLVFLFIHLIITSYCLPVYSGYALLAPLILIYYTFSKRNQETAEHDATDIEA